MFAAIGFKRPDKLELRAIIDDFLRELGQQPDFNKHGLCFEPEKIKSNENTNVNKEVISLQDDLLMMFA